MSFSFKEIDLYQFGHSIQITGMVLSTDAGDDVIVKFPDEPVREKSYHQYWMDMEIEDWEKFLHQTDVLETIVNNPEKAVVRKSQRQIDQNVAWAVFRRDGYRCRYCGRHDVPLTVDHIILWENGGPSIKDNLLSACRPCNRARGSMPYEQWMKSDRYKMEQNSLTDKLNFDILKKLSELEKLKVEKQRSR